MTAYRSQMEGLHSMHVTYLIIAASSLLLGLGAGFLMHRSDFCVTGMFRDFFLFRQTTLLHALVVLIVVSMAGFELARLGGLLSPYPFPLLGAPSLTTLAGGALFGFGMVLAGGCVVGTLYKMGSGHILSAVAFLGLIAGSTLYAEIHPWWSALAKASAIPGAGITLSDTFGLSPTLVLSPFLLFGIVLLWRWQLKGKLHTRAAADGYIQPWKTALGLALIGLFSYLVIGMPLGITTSYAKLGAGIEGLFLPQHVASLTYFNAVPLNYIPPFSSVTITGGAGPALDGIAAIQYPLIIGITLGATVSALRLGEFRLYYRLPAVQYLSALSGGIIVGLAARMTPGCNIWHLWGGIPILATQSLLFLLGLVPGAWLGSLALKRLVIR